MYEVACITTHCKAMAHIDQTRCHVWHESHRVTAMVKHGKLKGDRHTCTRWHAHIESGWEYVSNTEQATTNRVLRMYVMERRRRMSWTCAYNIMDNTIERHAYHMMSSLANKCDQVCDEASRTCVHKNRPCQSMFCFCC